MIRVEFEEVTVDEQGNDNIVRRRIEDYPLVIDVSDKYIAVEESGAYKIFEPGVVKSLHNDKGEVYDWSDEHQIPILNSFNDEYPPTVHGDPSKIN